jgi:thioredoxin 1
MRVSPEYINLLIKEPSNMSAITEITSVNSIQKGDVLLDFYTSTCAPCRMMAPALEEIAKEFVGLTVAKVDVTQSPEMSQMFGVMGVPTVILLSDLKVKEVSRGFSSKENLKTMVRRHISV